MLFKIFLNEEHIKTNSVIIVVSQHLLQGAVLSVVILLMQPSAILKLIQ